MCFYYQNYGNYFVYQNDFKSPWLWGNFHFRNNETEDMLVYQSNAEAVDLFSYVNTFFLLGLFYLQGF